MTGVKGERCAGPQGGTYGEYYSNISDELCPRESAQSYRCPVAQVNELFVEPAESLDRDSCLTLACTVVHPRPPRQALPSYWVLGALGETLRGEIAWRSCRGTQRT